MSSGGNGFAWSSSSSASIVSDSERGFILSGCRCNCRMDGRERTNFRPYIVETSNDGHLPLCHGSARLMGSVGHASHETQHLLAAVKAELVRPAELSPHHGVVEVYLHEQQPQGGSSSGNKRALEHQQDILSQLLTNQLVDTRALCIKAGEYVWKLTVDVWIFEAAGGSLLDCAAQVIWAALESTRLPQVTTPAASTEEPTNMVQAHEDSHANTLVVVEGDWRKSERVPMMTRPQSSSNDSLRCWVITVAVLLDYDRSTTTTKKPLYSLVVDLTLQEEACATALIHFCIVQNQIVALHKTSSGAFPLTLLPEITNIALQAVSSASRAYKYVSTSLHYKETSSAIAVAAQPHASLVLQEQFQWQPKQY